MKYLNERIVATLSGVNTTGLLQYRVYRLTYGNAAIDLENSDTYDIIFVGNYYRQSGVGLFSIDITDIVRNDIWIPREAELYDTPTGGEALNNKLVSAYYVHIPSTNSLSSQIQVAKVYPYPHYISTMQDNVFFNWINEVNSASFPLQGRYSEDGKGKYHLMPRYPYISTDNYRMILASEVGLNLTSYAAQFTGGLVGNFTVPFTTPSSHIKYTLSELYNNAEPRVVTSAFGTSALYPESKFVITTHSGGITIEANEQDIRCYCMLVAVNGTLIINRLSNHLGVGEINVTQSFIDNSSSLRLILSPDKHFSSKRLSDYDGVTVTFSNLEVGQHIAFNFTPQEESHGTWSISNQSIPIPFDAMTTQLEIAGDYVAQIDNCYSRYYLQWQDRMGGFQSQPFNDKYTYSESFETETLTDYKGRKRLSNVGVTGKFKINTDWIKEDLYPYYESIFTSPVLFLYDTKEDKRYSVLVTDSEYTEKTYSNQKKLFNLTLNLELNNKQNIVY